MLLNKINVIEPTENIYSYNYVIGYMKSFTSTNTINELLEKIYYYRDNDLVNPEEKKWRDLYMILQTELI